LNILRGIVAAGWDSNGNGGSRPRTLAFRADAGSAPSNDGALDHIGAGFAWVEHTQAGDIVHALRLDSDDCLAEAAIIPLGGPSLTIPAGRPCRREGTAAIITGATLCLAGAEFPVTITIASDTGWISFDAAVHATALAVSLRYFFPQNGPTGLGALRYPVVAESVGSTVSITGAFHAARPGDQAAGLTITGGATVYRTNFRTTLGQTITLAAIGGKSQIGYQWDPLAAAFYQVPKGDWQLGVEGQAVSRDDLDLLLGLSGIEFGRIGSSATLRFVTGAPAFVPGFGASGLTGSKSMTSICPGSPYPVTTSWLYPIESGPGPTSGLARGYYSQPQAAGLYTPGPSGTFLNVLSPLAGKFPHPADVQAGGATGVLGAPQASFPMVPYAGIGAGPPGTEPLDIYGLFETEVLNVARFHAIAEMNFNAGSFGFGATIGPTMPIGPTGPSGPVVRAVTSKGLMSDFAADLSSWERLVLARTSTGTSTQDLVLTGIDAELRTAMLGSQLFLVISDPDALQRHASVPYLVSGDVIVYFQKLGAPPPVLNGLGALAQMGAFAGRSYFEPDARIALGIYYDQPSGVSSPTWGQLLLREAALAKLTVNGWTFDLSPIRWTDDNGVEQTILILKFADRDFVSLVEDLAAWTSPGVFNKDPAATQTRLRKIIADAKASLAKGAQEFAYFVDTILGNTADSNSPAWNGVLFLNAFVPKNAFPAELEGLAAGITAPDFRAHHFGVNLSPFEVRQGRILLHDSALFGLIYYLDPGDLVFTGAPYDYKVLSLKILFANSEIVSFASQIELLIAQLFGESATLLDSAHGNNIILNGSWQKHGGTNSYSFTQEGASIFQMTSQVLDTIITTKAQFISEKPGRDAGASSQVTSRFLLFGSLRFKALDGFDLFSFGPGSKGPGELVFANMFVAMHLDRNSPTHRLFSFEAGQMLFDASASKPRPGSLVRRFPLSVSRMLQNLPQTVAGPTGASAPPPPPAKTATPAELGYLSVNTPLVTGALGAEWYGLEMNLNLGSRGALAGQAAINASLLAAWAPASNNYNVAVGLRLPGSDGRSIRIAGPLSLDIGAIEMMLTQPDDGYLMRFRNIALGFLGLKFPPGGRTNVLLFGDPNPDSNNSALGWYAAYKKDDKPKDKGSQATGLLDRGDHA
jgi:hypothetical protein